MQRDRDFHRNIVFAAKRRHSSDITYVFYVSVGYIKISELWQSESRRNSNNSEDLCSYYPIKWELASSRSDYKNK